MSDIEDKNQVAITPDDCRECLKFFQFFEIPVPTELQASFDKFIADPTFQHQNELKFQLADIIATSAHPVFADDVFVQIRPEVREVRENLVFERELEAQLTSTAD